MINSKGGCNGIIFNLLVNYPSAWQCEHPEFWCFPFRKQNQEVWLFRGCCNDRQNNSDKYNLTELSLFIK